MNKSCVACAASKVRCDLDRKGSSCLRCLQKGCPCVRAGRKKRTGTSTKGTSRQSSDTPQTACEDQSPDWAPLNEQPVNPLFLDTPSVDQPDILTQLADIENFVDVGSWAWSPEDLKSILGHPILAQEDITTLPDSSVSSENTTCEGILCPDNFRLPADYCLELERPEIIQVLRLETYARLFFSHFHQFLPLLHIPTFCLASSPSVLVRTICFIGASFGSHPSATLDARLIYGSLPSVFAKCCLRSDDQSLDFEEIQALVFLQFATMANGGVAERVASRLLHPLLVTNIRHTGFLKIHGECSKAARNAQSWTAWIRKESEKRVLWGVYTVDCYQSILCGSKPLLSPTDTRASFPCDNSSWNAYSASLWAELPAQDSSSCFLSSVRGLIVGQVTAESNINIFSLNLLVLAMHTLLLEAQTSLLPVDLSALERGLQTWYVMWKQFRRESHNLHEEKPGSILISNSLSLYRLAVHFLRNGRPVLDEMAYMEKSTNAGNPLVIKEQTYQYEMMQCVQRMLGESQEGEYLSTMMS
ncbi:hypothetical protein N7533_006468 [Penicillium manginii]|uniref:uncharacterized protein n=1 Tax=Penicillium manginii TaxID=203109 RepID=UPI002548A478|nr:uncharacterized protein N7533_006468 [Penicillium manginii]KAJ5749440.1 hypothetical protein N7533_006468 [Penicillium manginii]